MSLHASGARHLTRRHSSGIEQAPYETYNEGRTQQGGLLPGRLRCNAARPHTENGTPEVSVDWSFVLAGRGGGGCPDEPVKLVGPHTEAEHGLRVLPSLPHPPVGPRLQLQDVVQASLDVEEKLHTSATSATTAPQWGSRRCARRCCPTGTIFYGTLEELLTQRPNAAATDIVVFGEQEVRTGVAVVTPLATGTPGPGRDDMNGRSPGAEPAPVRALLDRIREEAPITRRDYLRMLVTMSGGLLAAYSSMCTHLSCTVLWNHEEGRID